MKSQRECYEKLLEGKKLRPSNFRSGGFACLNEEGVLVDEKGKRRYLNFFDFECWEVYEETGAIKEMKTDEDGVPYFKDACAKINELIKAVNKLMEDK